MPYSKTISEIYNEHRKSFLKHIKSAENLNEENIHKLRVDVKRLRALFKFLKALEKNKFNKKKALKLILPVFKSAGKIRTNTLNQKLIKVYRSNAIPGFKTYLEAKEKKQRRDFLSDIKKFKRKSFDKLHKETLSIFKKADQKNLSLNGNKYIKNLFSKIHADLPNISNDNHFHDIRKNLKDIKTITGLLTGLIPKKKLTNLQKKVDEVEEKIGKWHDTVILVQQLEKYISKNNDPDAILSERQKQINFNEKLSMLALNLKMRNEVNKKMIALQLKKNFFEGK